MNGRWCWGWKKWVILSLWKQVLALIYFYPKTGFKQWFFLIFTEIIYSKFLYVVQLMNWSAPSDLLELIGKTQDVTQEDREGRQRQWTTVYPQNIYNSEGKSTFYSWIPSAMPKPCKMLDVEGRRGDLKAREANTTSSRNQSLEHSGCHITKWCDTVGAAC